MKVYEFREGTPSESKYLTRKWVPTTLQQGDLVMLGGVFYIIYSRFLGMGEHIVVFVNRPKHPVSTQEAWVYPITDKSMRTEPVRKHSRKEEEEK